MSAVGLASVQVRATARRALWPVTAVVAVSATVQALLALTMQSPWIVPDELIYSEFAKSMAAGHLPAVRGVTSLSYGVVYPLLIAPAWLLTRVTSAYQAAHLINAVLVSLAAVPAYLLARRFVCHRRALAVSALVVVAPSTVYASTILVENALYPAFLLALLAIVRALERPTVPRQLAALAAIGLAFEVKALAGVLVPAYVCSILLHGRGAGPGGLRRFRPTFALVGVGGALALAAAGIATGNPARVVGAYAVVLRHVDLIHVPWWFLLHVAELDLYVFVLPFAATLLLVCLVASGRIADPRARLFAYVSVPVAGLTIAAVAAFSSRPNAGAVGFPATTARLHERSTFVLVPLLIVGLALWLELGLPRPRGWAAGSAAVAAALPAVLPISQLRQNANFQALALVPALVLGAVGAWWLVVALGAGLLLGLAFLHAQQGRTRILWVAVGAWFVVVATFVHSSVLAASRDARAIAVGPDRTWIDDAVGTGAHVAVLWQEPGTGIARSVPRQQVVWVNEFFNRSVGTVYELGAQLPYDLPATRVSVRRGAVVAAGGREIRSTFVLALCRLGVVGTVVAFDPSAGAAVYRTDGVVRLAAKRSARCPGPAG